jgi:hypothetical protein
MPVLPRRWDALAWTEFRDLPAGSVAILPVAAIEQHGPHLPLAVDAALNAAILDRALALAPQEMPLLALPPQVIGHSPEHARFPGTLTLGAETILALWTEIGACVARAGVRRLVRPAAAGPRGGHPAGERAALGDPWRRDRDRDDAPSASGIRARERGRRFLVRLDP